jgi:hypothetical protein
VLVKRRQILNYQIRRSALPMILLIVGQQQVAEKLFFMMSEETAT